MKVTLSEIARVVQGRLSGNPDTPVTGLAGVYDAGPGDLTFLADRKYLPALGECRAAAVLVPDDLVFSGLPLIHVPDPDAAFALVAERFFLEPVTLPRGVHPSAVVAGDVVLDPSVVVSPFVVLEAGARVGARSVLYPGVYVGHGTTVGTDCVLYPNVVLRERVEVGNRCILHPGVVIGSDGFGYLTTREGHRKVVQVGSVRIEDDVEIGANTTVDRARVGLTVIGRGTKIDNLVQVAHNVRVGRNCLLVSQSGLAGSVRLGDRSVLGGQAGVREHVSVGPDVVVAGRAGVTKDLSGPAVVSGLPAQDHRTELRFQATLRRVPFLMHVVEELRKRIATLEAQSKNRRP